MPKAKRIREVLVTGASGALGRRLIPSLLDAGYRVRALIHQTPLEIAGVECVTGNIADADFVLRAAKGMDAVCQLATSKEDPKGFFDVSLRGTFNLLEAARQVRSIRRWVLAGGDAAMGIYHYPQPVPINETMPHRAYPGVYAFSKVIEEVMAQQYHIQYDLPCVCLRASWIMHDEMIFRALLASRWRAHLTPAQAKRVAANRDAAAIVVHPDGGALVRHIVSIHDVVSAFLLALDNPASVGQTFNIAAASAFSYDVAAKYLAGKLELPTMRIKVPQAYDFQIDITKARSILGYQPQFDIFQMIDEAVDARKQQPEPA